MRAAQPRRRDKQRKRETNADLGDVHSNPLEGAGRAVIVLEDSGGDEVSVHVTFAPQLEELQDGSIAGTPAQLAAMSLLEAITAEDAGGTTSPEELIAAAHSSCYAMQLSALIAQAGGTPQSLDVTAEVTLGPDPKGGFAITGIALTVRGEVEGLDADGFEKAAQAAKEGCPVSKALAGTTITLDAGLE